MKYLKLVIFLFAVSLGAQNYQYSIDQRSTILQEEEGDPPENTNAIVIPQDFDWNNIPTDYDNAVWIIKYDFDLKDRRVSLPENVTLSFEGGILRKATLEGDGTLVASNGNYQVFETIDLDGTFKNEYLKPCWFGAVMDGVTDDWVALVETIKESNRIGSKVLIEEDMFTHHDVRDASRSIFLEDNTWIEGANDANLIVNNMHSPVFYMALTKDITIKNLTLLWDNAYDARYYNEADIKNANVQRLEDYLSENHNINFVSSNPIFRGPRALYSILSLHACENILLDNVTFKAKGETADKFIRWGIKLREEFTANQTITNSDGKDLGVTGIPKNIRLKNVTMDGVLMGIQGTVDGFTSEGLRSYRYSDLQTASGTHLGGFDGSNYIFPPPHLIYLNNDSSMDHHCRDVTILNTIDYGNYVGTEDVRPTISGYCNSLKLVEDHENVLVDDYKSYRRDGLGDLGSINNGVFKNLYSESTSHIFDPDFKFPSLRFIGTLNKVSFENIIIKDNSAVSEIYPLDVTNGDYVTMNNVQVFVNELNTNGNGPFGIHGSNNRVVNSSLKIENHTATKEYIGVVYLNDEARENSSNNHYDIEVEGWRDLGTRNVERSIRILLHESSNPNNNYAKVTDLTNEMVIEQINESTTRNPL